MAPELIDYLASSYKAPLAAGIASGFVTTWVVGALMPEVAMMFGDPGIGLLATLVLPTMLGALLFRRWIVALKKAADIEKAGRSQARGSR